MNDEELDRKLRLLDAVNGMPDRSVDHPAAKTALFEEITMTDTTTRQLDTRTVDDEPGEPNVIAWRPARSPRRRALTMLAAAAAGVGVIGAGIVIVESGGAQTAEAMILEAAAESAEFTSGRITTTIQVDEFGDDPGSNGLVGVIEYRFDDDDFRTEMTTDLAGQESAVFGQLSVDGVHYIQHRREPVGRRWQRVGNRPRTRRGVRHVERTDDARLSCRVGRSGRGLHRDVEQRNDDDVYRHHRGV